MSNEKLVKQIQDGINVHENLESLWENNSGYVATIARKYEVAEELEDLINQGFIGLYKAVEMYKPDKGAKFLTYATYWITQSIQRYIQNCGKLSRVPGMCSLDKPIGEEEDMSMYDLIPGGYGRGCNGPDGAGSTENSYLANRGHSSKRSGNRDPGKVSGETHTG